MSNSQLARDMMIPMTQEFVSEINDGETKLNEEIDDLLNGIDFQQSHVTRKITQLHSIYIS